jgi:hypothetical protein
MRALLLLFLLNCARTGAAPSAEWSLEQTTVFGKGTRTLMVESAIVIRADREGLLIHGCPAGDSRPDVVMLDIHVFSEGGSERPTEPQTGPASAFIGDIVVPAGQSRRFLVSSELFSVEKSGWYVAKARLLARSKEGHALDIPLREHRFFVSVEADKKNSFRFQVRQ